MKLILAAIVLALLWQSRRKTAICCQFGNFGEPHDCAKSYREDDDSLLPVDPYTWTLA